MKVAHSSSHIMAEIEEQILDLLQTNRRLMFPEIASALPEYTWHTLLSALKRLRERRQVELLAQSDHAPK